MIKSTESISKSYCCKQLRNRRTYWDIVNIWGGGDNFLLLPSEICESLTEVISAGPGGDQDKWHHLVTHKCKHCGNGQHSNWQLVNDTRVIKLCLKVFRGQQHMFRVHNFNLRKILNTFESSSQPFLRVSVSDWQCWWSRRGIIMVWQHCAETVIQRVSQSGIIQESVRCPSPFLRSVKHSSENCEICLQRKVCGAIWYSEALSDLVFL